MLQEILMFLAGIGVFLFAIDLLSKNLESLCGNKIRKGFKKIGNSYFKSAGLGFGINALLQSSTASIMMIIGFTSAGMISLFQSVGITIGANLGSAIAPFLVSFSTFNIMEFFCALAGIGAFAQLFTKKKIVKKISNTVISFALVFVGLELMSSATAVFKTNASFINFFTTISNPILLILIGTAFTTLIQSSLGTIAILMTLIGTSTVAGVLPFESAVFLLYGANLGTSLTTAIFGSLSSGVDSKRVALFHVLSRLFGIIVFALLSLTPWLRILDWIGEPSIKLAVVNLLFNLFNTIVCLPLLKPIVWLLRKIIPSKTQKPTNELEIEFVEGEATSVAIAKATDKNLEIFLAFQKIFNKTLEFVQNEELSDIKAISDEIQTHVNYNNKLNKYIVQISTDNASEKNFVDRLLIINKELDRNTRNCLKIIRSITDDSGKKINFSSKSLKNLIKLEEKVNELIDLCEPYVKNPDCDFPESKRPNFSSILEIIQEISTLKLNAKTSVMKNGFNSQLSIKKNTRYLYVLNYLGLIANNILDFVFAFETDSKERNPNEKTYEQLDIDNLNALNDLSQEVKTDKQNEVDTEINE